MQERTHAFAMKSQMWLLDPRPHLPDIVRAVEKGFELSANLPPHIRMAQIWRAAIPYVVFGLLVLALIIAWPPLATWLPRALLG